MPGRERIAVTGLGLVTSLGFGREASFSRLCRGERGITPVSLFDTAGLKAGIAAEVRGLDVRAIAPRGEADDWSRSDALAFLAAREALSQAAHPEGAPLALALGGTTGGMYETERALSKIAPGAVAPTDARRLLDFPLAITVERVARSVGAVGPRATVCSACSSGAVALTLAASWLLSGRAQRVVAGGVDGLCQLTFAGFNALGAVDVAPSRPFDVSRAGLTLGEGAGCVVLELESSARARGVPILAFFSGWSVGAEAHHVTHPEPTGTRASAVLLEAIRVAGLTPSDIDYVNAHGTGTVQNDAMEARALERVFGADVGRVWVSSCKAQVGHTLGAAGAIEAVITALSVQRGALPPTAGLENPEAPQLRHVRGFEQRAPLRAALSSSFGFGGACAVLAFEAPESEPRALSAPKATSIVISGAASYGPGGLSSGAESARHLEPEREVGTVNDASADPLALLEPERSRRFGRSSALVISTAQGALRSAACEPEHTGIIVGSAFGDVDRSVRFLQKVLGRGPKFASPAEFPQLIASTGSGNASLYLGLQGPCLSVSEFGTSGESALAVGVAALELGLSTSLLAGAAEAHDAIVDDVLAPASGTPRGEGGGFVLLETASAAAARGHVPLARLLEHRAVRGDVSRALAELPAPSEHAFVVSGRLTAAVTGALLRSPWQAAPRHCLPELIGYHEAIGATALAVAVAALAAGRAALALVLSAELDVVYLTCLARFEGAP